MVIFFQIFVHFSFISNFSHFFNILFFIYSSIPPSLHCFLSSLIYFFISFTCLLLLLLLLLLLFFSSSFIPSILALFIFLSYISVKFTSFIISIQLFPVLPVLHVLIFLACSCYLNTFQHATLFFSFLVKFFI